MEFENSLRTPNRRIYVILEGLAERFDAVFGTNVEGILVLIPDGYWTAQKYGSC